jgi:integrase
LGLQSRLTLREAEAQRPLLNRAGIRHRKPHTLRRTFAILLLENRESPACVKEQITADTGGNSTVPSAVAADGQASGGNA